MDVSIPRPAPRRAPPAVGAAVGVPVTFVADAFIPWNWVQIPEPPAVGPTGGPIVAGAGTMLDVFVHGDGRMPVSRPADIRGRYRTYGIAEVNLVERPGERFTTAARNQTSKSELRLATGRVLHTQTGRGPLSSTIAARRTGPTTVRIAMTVGGSVPASVAGPQPAIDFHYEVDLAYDPANNRVSFVVNARHDGFPGHECFIVAGGRTRFNRHYLPAFFSRPSPGTARPSIAQSLQGAAALGGTFARQTWRRSGSFTP